MKRFVSAAVVVVALAVSGTGLADARPVTPASKKLSGGAAGVTACGVLTGVVSNFTISGGTVTAVILSAIPTTCNGGSVWVTLTASGTSVGSGGPVTVASGAATVPVSPAPATGSITHVRIAISGP